MFLHFTLNHKPNVRLQQYSSSFDMAYNFIFISFHDFCQFGKLQIHFGVMAKVVIQTLQKKFNVEKPKTCLKRFVLHDFFNEP
jgi:hypothetical protein